MVPTQIVQLTRNHLPALAQVDLEIHPIVKGGSGRKFFRIIASDGTSLIFVKYTSERRENARFVEIARFLKDAGLRVPRIHDHDPKEGLIWMDDLGTDDLCFFQNASWDRRAALYRSTLSQAHTLHQEATERFTRSRIDLEPEFTKELYHWEQDYFFTHCLGNVFHLKSSEINSLRSLPVLSEIIHRLAALPCQLVHRDFQSQNVIIRSDEAWIIDFQGMRPGLAQYDVASLLYDPYVRLSTSEREDLLNYYLGLARPDDESTWRAVFDACALQRLMQALGAYGFLGLQKGKPEFLAYISPALENLRDVASRIQGMEPLLRIIDTLPEPHETLTEK